MTSIEDFEKRLKINTKALKEFKKIINEIKSKDTYITVSTEFTVSFYLKEDDGNDPFNNTLHIEIESYFRDKHILIERYPEHRRIVKLELNDNNLEKIYEETMKLFKGEN